MIKLLFSITAVALLASIVFGIQNRSTFVENREKREVNNNKIDSILNTFETEETPELTTAHQALYDAEDRLATYTAQKETANEAITRLDGEIAAKQPDLTKVEEELAEAQTQVDSLKSLFPGVNLENLGDVINELKSDVDDVKGELAAKQTEVEIVEKKVAANNATINRYEERQANRLVTIRRNATEGTVTAVNRDWGFVVINVGQRQGVEGDSSLIVKRAGQRIANLNIVEVKPNVTVADIRQKALSGVVQPGDQVIFQNLGE